jgi:hypothetical protein
VSDSVDQLSKLLDYATRHVFEPAFDWVLEHPIISVLVVVGLIYWSVRGYRMM